MSLPARTRRTREPIHDRIKGGTIEHRPTECPECGESLGDTDQTCQKCGHPVSYAPDEVGVHCAVCGAEIGAYTQKCPSCGEAGYPALRPRRGRKWKGSEPEGLPKESFQKE